MSYSYDPSQIAAVTGSVSAVRWLLQDIDEYSRAVEDEEITATLAQFSAQPLPLRTYSAALAIAEALLIRYAAEVEFSTDKTTMKPEGRFNRWRQIVSQLRSVLGSDATVLYAGRYRSYDDPPPIA
ncbi:MAG: hypothetical protein KatS3mg109_2155 [Pirellulaceae bacterium]|nr:MAG: hypothetical protein KatS3mg105_5279 [Gemmatales bacterium]GIW91723.1 MAG: hypothetical protein KatS3mg109_2155 [Pirellulaceae bacterium]